MDIAIAVAVGVLTCLLAFMGVYVTLHPPRKVTAKRSWKIAFCVVAFLACVAIGWQTKRNGDTQSSLQSQLDQIRKNTEQPPHVTVNIPPSPPPQIVMGDSKRIPGSLNLSLVEFPPALEADKPFPINLHLKNVGQVPVPNVFYWEIATFQPIGPITSIAASNTADRKAYSVFLNAGKKAIADARRAGHSPTYYAVGDDHWGTINLSPRQQEIDGIMRGSARLYLFAYAQWDDGDYKSCRWLQPPPDVHYGSGANLVLHDCMW